MPISIESAFDPELRRAQAEFDAYLSSRPEQPEILNTDAVGNVVEEEVVATAGVRNVLPLAEQPDITKSFERPVIAVHPQSKLNKLGMEIDDVRDNLDFPRPPYTVEYIGPEAMQLTERLLPAEAVAQIRRIGQHYKPGVFRRIDIVGDKEKGTNHPHIYFLDTSEPGVTRMYFVDPEDKVAVNDRLRPSIVNAVGIEVPDNELESPKVAILRYKIPKYEFGVKKEGRGPDELKSVIAEVLDSGGELPDILCGEAENQVLFLIAGDSYSSRVQARYSTKQQMYNFAKGGKGSSALEGKVLMQAHVVNKLIRLFYQPSNKVTEVKR